MLEVGRVVEKSTFFHISQKKFTFLHCLFSHSVSLVSIVEILFHLSHFVTIRLLVKLSSTLQVRYLLVFIVHPYPHAKDACQTNYNLILNWTVLLSVWNACVLILITTPFFSKHQWHTDMKAHMNNVTRPVNNISSRYHTKVMKHKPKFRLSAFNKTSKEFGICHKQNWHIWLSWCCLIVV